MSSTVISVEGLSKLYRIGLAEQRHESLLTASLDAMKAPLRNFRNLWRLDTSRAGADGDEDEADLLWALRDVSFEVAEGEVLGVIGRNGAGKSTLLKILSRVTQPTSGRVVTEGRLSSLLEVGTGFHPELSGRDNVYLNGTILGMTRREIDRKFDAIVDFSGIEKFLDTPIKRYSSGMKVRLAFAVAAHLEPEILIVDEVLAVGDADFQQKCTGKMKEMAEGGGRTVLFVSHSMQAISTLTSRCLVMEEGRLGFEGSTEEAIQHYLKWHQASSTYEAPPARGDANVTRVELVTTDPGNIQRNGGPLEIRVDLHASAPIRGARLAIQVLDHFGRPVVLLSTVDAELEICRGAGTTRLVCTVPNLRLYMGRYALRVNFVRAVNLPPIEILDSICPFEVVMYGQHRSVPWRPNMCVYTEEAAWAVEAGVGA